jgi:anti-sigma factor RsiW
MNCIEIQELIHGYLDAELTIPQALQIERHLDGCETCQRVYRQVRALRSAVREQAPYYPTPPSLRRRVINQVHTAGAAPVPRTLTVRWWQAGAALAGTALLTWTLTTALWSSPVPGHLPDDILASHLRSLLAANVADVLSSDQHTVKPWFNGKLDFSPPVHDLAAQGFPLVGGRLDYLNGRPVAALVYRHRQHIINLFVWPAGSTQASRPILTSRQGYHLLHWTDEGMTFWAISDLNSDELEQFQRLLQPEDTTKSNAATP